MLASTFVAQLTYYWKKEHSGNIHNGRNNAQGATCCTTLYIVVYKLTGTHFVAKQVKFLRYST